MPRNATNVIYPSTVDLESSDAHAVLEVKSGATSCQVEQGPWHKGTTTAVFIVQETRIDVALVEDPVFGMKVTKRGSLIQVKKGTVRVATTRTHSSKAVSKDQQMLVSSDGSLGTITPLKLDPILKPGLCTLTPNLRRTNVITASGAHPGGNPLGLAADRNGNIWFTDDETPAIGVLNVKTGRITYSKGNGLNPGSVPRFIAADTAGNIWFTVNGPTPAIGVVDPRKGTITEYELRPGSRPWAPAYDPIHKLVWFTDQRKPTGAIGSLDPRTGMFMHYTSGLRPGSHPEGIAVDKKGNVWFTDDNDPSPAIGTLDAKTHEIHEYSTGLVPGSLPRAITIGLDGNVWFTDQRTEDNRKLNAPGDGLIGMISPTDPKHRIVEYAVAANGGNRGSVPQGLAWYRGYVWFTDDGATKAIGRIDPSTGAITESSKGLVATSKPIGILVTKGVLWFTDRLKDSPTIGRLEARPSC
jgi:streptogramin lyase